MDTHIRETSNGTAQNAAGRSHRQEDTKDDLEELIERKILDALRPIQAQLKEIVHDLNNAEASGADISRQLEALQKLILPSSHQGLLFRAYLKL